LPFLIKNLPARRQAISIRSLLLEPPPQSGTAKAIAGLPGGKIAGKKKFLEKLDSRQNILYSLVPSLLTQTQRRKTAKPVAQFFNNQTTDKCGRLIADAKDFGLLAQIVISARTAKRDWIFGSGQSVF
jgi:hypothetical protein